MPIGHADGTGGPADPSLGWAAGWFSRSELPSRRSLGDERVFNVHDREAALPAAGEDPQRPYTRATLVLGMGREQKRAADRELAKRERESQRVARRPKPRARPPAETGGILEGEEETARRLYRTGGAPRRTAKAPRRVIERPRKWKEGRH